VGLCVLSAALLSVPAACGKSESHSKGGPAVNALAVEVQVLAPQPIENKMKTNKYFTEIVMIGNKRNFPAALIVPNFEQLEKWAREQGIAFADRKQLVAKPEVVSFYQTLVNDLSTDLAQFERMKKITLLPQEFTLEAGELTPTLKVKRRFVEQKYQALIDAMYEGAGG